MTTVYSVSLVFANRTEGTKEALGALVTLATSEEAAAYAAYLLPRVPDVLQVTPLALGVADGPNCEFQNGTLTWLHTKS